LARDIADSRQDLPAILGASRLAPKKNLLGLVQAFAMSQKLQEHANLVLLTGGLDNPLHEAADNEFVEDTVLAPIRDVVQEHDLWGKIQCLPITLQLGKSDLAAMSDDKPLRVYAHPESKPPQPQQTNNKSNSPTS
jgi:sucrose-phosphate synthase